MKKLILSAVILLGSLSAFAQTTPEKENTTTKAVTAETSVNQTPISTEVASQVAVVPTDGYTEIKAEELPVALTDALKKSFPDAKLAKANINEQKQYKLDVEVGNRVGSLYADETGKWIQK